MFSIEMLPANEGDCLWIEYGNPLEPNRILIDCGYKSTYRKVMERLRSRPEEEFELFVLTHIDRDHILGAVPFIKDGDIDKDRIGEIWFNGREQIDDALGVRDAEYFTKTIQEKGFKWNTTFNGNPVKVPDSGPGDPITLDGGMRITILSPGQTQLEDLLEHWENELDDILEGRELEEMLDETPSRYEPDVLGEPDVEALAMSAFKRDDTPPNGSSIAFLAEYTDEFDGGKQKSAVFLGDAFPQVVEDNFRLLLDQRGAGSLLVDALKISHHGSRNNTSSSLLELVQSRHYLISTSGSRHHHPHQESIARILKAQDHHIDLHFNYNSQYNEMWASDMLANDYDYTPFYPKQNKKGFLKLEL
jgi:beta-lactamase superfamily II metal-dependent hydrolase